MDTPGLGTPSGTSGAQTSVQSSPPNHNLVLYGAIAAIVLVIVGAAGYFFYQWQQSAVSLYKGKITIGYTIWPGYLGLYIADQEGFFKDAGLDVELKLYPGFAELSEAYMTGEIQGKANLTLDAIDEAYRGLDHKVVIAVDHSNGSDGIIANPSIKSMQEIKGKKVAYEYGTLGEFFLVYALEENAMTLADIVPLNMAAEPATEALVKGEADVAVTFEPFMSDAVKNFGANKIYSSADAPGLITDVLTFRSDFIQANPATVDAIVGAYFRGIQFWKTRPEQANAAIGAALGVSGQEAVAQLRGIEVLDERDNQTAFTFAAGLESLYGNMRRVGEFIKGQSYPNDKKIDTDTLIDRTFIQKFAE